MNEELNTVETTTEETEQTEKTGKFYTDEEIAALEQKAGDKRISQYQKTLEKKNRESERLNRMTETEKLQYQLDERERLIEEKERALALAENKVAVSKILADKGLSQTFVDFCVDEDADVMNERITKIEKAFKASVKAEVEKRIGSKAPTKSNVDNGQMTLAEFKKLSIAEQQSIYNSDRELYDLLISQ